MSGPNVWILLLFVGLEAKRVVLTIPLINDHDVIYRGNVSVGNPAKTFEAVFYTGCILTRFPGHGCTASARFPDSCKEKNTYNPKKSKTAEPHMFPKFDVGEAEDTHFGSKGRMFYDTLSFGTPKTKNFLKLTHAAVGASQEVWDSKYSVVCLGITPGVAEPGEPENDSTFVDASNQFVTKKPWMTVALRKCDRGVCADGGAVTLGGLDTRNCKSDIHWVPGRLGRTMWGFQMSSVLINGHRLASKVLGNVNNGHSHIYIPKSFMPNVLTAFKARKQGENYTAACDSKFEFTFLIGGRKIHVNEEHLLLKSQQVGNECVVAITERSQEDQMFVLGSPFFRATCVLHDITEPEHVGFATIKSQQDPKAGAGRHKKKHGSHHKIKSAPQTAK